MARRGAALERLDDDHATAAAWTSRLAWIDGGIGGPAFRFCNGEQLTRACDVVGAGAAGEQAVVTDAMEASRQDVDQEAADELAGGQCHDLLALATIGAIVLPSEGDAVVADCDQPAVGDGDAVSVARQIGEQRFGSAERPTMTSGRTGHWTKMHQSLVKFSESEASNHMSSLADFTTTTPELKFSVHTPEVARPRSRRRD